MTHPGVGPITALATEVFLGNPARFADSKALASYVGLIPREYSSGGRQRLGGLNTEQFTRAVARPASLWHQPETWHYWPGTPSTKRRNKTQDRNSSTDNVAKFHIFAEPHDVVRSPGVIEQVGVDAC
jgi:Transposase IS116/IS110/IS902 family